MTHFHYYEDAAMHCNSWICSLENRVEDIMEAFAEVEKFKQRTVIDEKPAGKTRVASESITEADQKTFHITVSAEASKEELREALYELAVFRWQFHAPEEFDTVAPQELDDLPPIFSYVDDDGATVYFFKSLYRSAPRGWNPLTHENVLWTHQIADNKMKIPVTKLPPTAAKKLFSR